MDIALCHDCRIKHPVETLAAFNEFALRHPEHRVGLVPAWQEYTPNADIRLAYGTLVAPTITLNSLASSATAGRKSAAVDVDTTKYLDLLAFLTVDMPTSGTPANDKTVYLFAAGSIDGGTDYTEAVTGGDAAYTHTDPTNLRQIGAVSCPSVNVVHRGGPFSVANAFGGILPKHVVFVVRNYTGLTLDSSGNNLEYLPIFATVV